MSESEKIKQKIQAFEYIIIQLLKWYNEGKALDELDKIPDDFDKLKVFMLLFYVVQSKVSPDDEGLLSIFDNFVAMPYGSIEMDVYNNLDLMEIFEFVKVDNKHLLKFKQKGIND